MIVSDEITLQMSITDACLEQGRFGQLCLVAGERRFTNQLGTLCAVLRTTLVRR
jgi:hypothetical protein